MTALSPRQQAIVARLAADPADTWELAKVTGHGRDRSGQAYVSTVIHRLRTRDGYVIRNRNEGRKRLGAVYELLLAGGLCHSCGAKLNRWNSDGVCWPCQWSAAESELAALHGQMELARVAS